MENKKTVSILHLSDLHFSKKIKEDFDAKVLLPINPRSEKVDKFRECIKELPTVPDFVVVSGDITLKGENDGFKLFNEFVKDLIRKGKLPPVDRFIVVPGNHDVKAGDTMEDSSRWEDFNKSIGSKYLIPWIVGAAPNYDNMVTLVNSVFAGTSSRLGGAVYDSSTGERNSLPFLVDKDKKVIFYAFNSSLLSHTRIRTLDNIIKFIDKHGADRNEAAELMQKVKSEMEVDPARVIGDEIKLFTYCMRQIREILRDEYDSFLKIAVLHHHVAPIACSEEIKKFELLINAGFLKKVLVDYGFHVVLHGHKHWNEVYQDTAISGGGTLLVVAGGTIFGDPAPNKRAGFYLLNFSTGEKSVETCYYELMDSYRSPAGTHEKREIKFNAINHKPESSGEERKVYKLNELFSRVKFAIINNLNSTELLNEKLYGWSRIITEKNKVGMMSTAYGLIIANMLGIAGPEHIADWNNILNTLWKFRLKGGGFSAISQTENPSIEATVCALRAFFYAKDTYRFEATLNDLWIIMDQYQLDEKMSITTLTLIMDVLCECQPDNINLSKIEEIIRKKAYYSDDGTLLYWPVSADNKEGSVIQTVLAVNSLTRYAAIKHQTLNECLKKCGEWVLNSEWNNVEEIISRPVSVGREDRLVYQHYTAPWGIIALLRLGYRRDNKRIESELRKILEDEKNGLWEWNNKSHYPIWVIYDVVLAIKEYILSDIIL